MADELLDSIVETQVGLAKAYLGEKIKGLNIHNQNGSNLVFLHGKDVAKKLGLSEDDIKQITPFPATQTVVIESPVVESPVIQQPDNKGPSLLRRVLSLALPAITGAGITMGGLSMLGKTEPEKPVDINNPTVEQRDSKVGFTVE